MYENEKMLKELHRIADALERIANVVEADASNKGAREAGKVVAGLGSFKKLAEIV